jgi:hypothetical protein
MLLQATRDTITEAEFNAAVCHKEAWSLSYPSCLTCRKEQLVPLERWLQSQSAHCDEQKKNLHLGRECDPDSPVVHLAPC